MKRVVRIVALILFAFVVFVIAKGFTDKYAALVAAVVMVVLTSPPSKARRTAN